MSSKKELLRALPESPGVYIFKDEGGTVIYVGKSNSIKKRVSSHLRSSMSDKIASVEHVVTSGELSALILEAKLIKQLKPKYNVLMRDDKAYPYIKLTLNEEFPGLQVARKTVNDGSLYFGPFRGGTAREIMRLLYKLFGIRGCTTKTFRKRQQPCLKYYIKICSAPCSGAVSSKDYRRRVEDLIDFMDGGVEKAVEKMKNDMEKASHEMDYERAAQIRNRIYWIERARDRVQAKPASGKGGTAALKELERSLGMTESLERIEAFDISNTGPSGTVGAMAVFQKGAPKKEHYRKYNIKLEKLPDDTGAMYETVYRRLAGSLGKSLPLPDLMVIDGGQGQLGAAVRAIKDAGHPGIRVIGLAKKMEEIYFPGLREALRIPHDSPALLLLRRVRDEVHRFAVAFHRKKRSEAMKGLS